MVQLDRAELNRRLADAARARRALRRATRELQTLGKQVLRERAGASKPPPPPAKPPE
jgi:hypothetical protein